MGSSTDAHCFACGYDTFLLIGGGMESHRENSRWPVSCRKCSAITTANYKKAPLICDECNTSEVTPIDDPSMWQGDSGTANAIGPRDRHYRCPKCGQFELRFGTDAGEHGIVLWD